MVIICGRGAVPIGGGKELSARKWKVANFQCRPLAPCVTRVTQAGFATLTCYRPCCRPHATAYQTKFIFLFGHLFQFTQKTNQPNITVFCDIFERFHFYPTIPLESLCHICIFQNNRHKAASLTDHKLQTFNIVYIAQNAFY